MSSVHDNGRIGELRTKAGLHPMDLLREAAGLNDRVDVCRELGVTPWQALEDLANRRPAAEVAAIAFRALLLR